MKSTFSKLIFLVFLLLNVTISFSQTDSSKTINNEVSKTFSTPQLKAVSSNKRFRNTNNINIDTKISEKTIQENLNNNPVSEKSSILLQNRPEDKDIVGLKYWKGKDVTHKRLASTYGLGTISTKSRIVRIEARDHSYIDGDRIKVYLNEQVISDNIGLKSNYFVIYVPLKEGYNRIDFQALNQGTSGPNTAEFSVYDANGNLLSDKQWNLLTGQTATLGVIRQ